MQSKKFLIYFIMICFFSIAAQYSVYAEEKLTGRQIMLKAEKENKTKDQIALMTMEIRRGKYKRVRKLKMWMKNDKNDNDKTLIRFLWPADVKRSGFLKIEHSNRDDDMWLYLPVLKKTRRIASSGKSGSFMGSDFAYADMGTSKIDNYKYKLTGTEKIDEKECYVIEAVPSSEKIKKDDGYSKKIVWVRKDIFLQIQQEFYDKDGDYLKIMKSSRIKKIQGTKVWMATHIIMSDMQKEGNKTVIEYGEIKLNTGVLNKYFTQRYLLRGR